MDQGCFAFSRAASNSTLELRRGGTDAALHSQPLVPTTAILGSGAATSPSDSVLSGWEEPQPDKGRESKAEAAGMPSAGHCLEEQGPTQESQGGGGVSIAGTELVTEAPLSAELGCPWS